MAANYRDDPISAGVYRDHQLTPDARATSFASSADNIPMRQVSPGASPGYAPLATPGSGSAWLAAEQRRSRRSRFIVIGALVTIVIIIAAVAAGVTVAKKHSKPADRSASGSASAAGDAAGGSSSGGSSAGTGTSSSAGATPSGPASFTKNPALRNAFYGIAYSPNGAILPNCGATQEDVITDIQLMSQLTTRIRLYGADCNVTALVLNAIKLTQVNLQVFVANFIELGDPTAFPRQKALIEDALTTYGASNVLGVTVGNEVMLGFCTDNGLADATNDAAVMPAVTYITESITATRQGLAALGFGSLQVGNSDAGSYFNHLVLEAIDFGLANVHPWFAHVDVSAAAAWTTSFFQQTDVDAAANTTKKPTMYIAETGWPTASDDVADQTDGSASPGGDASVANLQTFLDTFVCSANTGGILYFFFEFFDEAWQAQLYGGVEGHWGLFDTNKNLKNITIPTCSHP